MSTTFAPERLEQVIEEPFIIEGWDDVPQCQSTHRFSELPCLKTATFVCVRTCKSDSFLWCANVKKAFDAKRWGICSECNLSVRVCWTVRSL